MCVGLLSACEFHGRVHVCALVIDACARACVGMREALHVILLRGRACAGCGCVRERVLVCVSVLLPVRLPQSSPGPYSGAEGT